MKKEQINEVIKLKEEMIKKYPMWREGQSFFNALDILYPSKSNLIRGTSLDPFHNNSKIEECIDYLLNLGS